jgi:CubicO group peptidase (beta-lactamase class C family)
MKRVCGVFLYDLGLSAGVFIGVLGCGGGSSSPTSGSQPTTLSSAVDSVVSTAMQQQRIPGMAVALAKNGTMLYVKAFGFSDMAMHATTQANTIFEIGSVTKQFTAALIMKLQEQGKLNVDDPVNKYLAKYNFPAPITLRMLLTHTSGLANYTTFAQYPGWARNGVSEPTVLTGISQASLLFPPGTQWSYSNSNYFVLGAIIENVSGQSYSDNLGQYIFQPLALTNTFYSMPPSEQSAIGYTGNASYSEPALLVDRSAPFAAGALSSNVYDLVAWDNALIHGKVVSPASFHEMTTPVDVSISGGGSYGFGLGLRTFKNRPTIWHNGSINGFTAETDVFLDTGFAVVVLTNSDAADPDAIATQIMNAVCSSAELSPNC